MNEKITQALTIKRKVRIVGAGFSGLTSAYYLVRAGFEVEIFDERPQVGGMIQTLQLSNGRVEKAANGLLNSYLVEDLFKDLGLTIQGTSSQARKRYIYRDGHPRRWSLKFFETLRFLIKLPFLVFFRRRFGPRPFESISQFGRRILGKSASQFTIETVLQGIYAGDPERMSASQILQRFFGGKPASLANRDGEATARLSLRGTIAPVGGMQNLMKSLEKWLRNHGTIFHLSHSVSEAEANQWSSHAPVIVCGSASQASRLFTRPNDERGSILRSIEMLPLVTSTVFFEKSIGVEGFGCLFPPTDHHQALGVLLNNYIFEGAVTSSAAMGTRPNSNSVFSETWMLGGALFKSPYGNDVSRISDEQVLEMIQGVRKTRFAAHSAILGSEITRWPQALPHYTTELERDLPSLQGMKENILLMGNYLGQIGLAKILERAAELPVQIRTDGFWNEASSEGVI